MLPKTAYDFKMGLFRSLFYYVQWLNAKINYDGTGKPKLPCVIAILTQSNRITVLLETRLQTHQPAKARQGDLPTRRNLAIFAINFRRWELWVKASKFAGK